MVTVLEKEVYKWLQLLGIKVSREYLQKKLLTHPDFPSLLSVTDTLDELNVYNEALIVNKEKFDAIPVPFMIQMPDKENTLGVVKNVHKFLKKNPLFLKKWDGVVLLGERRNGNQNQENHYLLGKEKKQKKQLVGFFSILFTFLLYTYISHATTILVFLNFASLIGLTVAVLIVQHELGYDNNLTNVLCRMGKNIDCNAVLKSSKSDMPHWLRGSDVAIIYFSSIFLLTTIESYFGNSNIIAELQLLSLLVMCAIPVTFFSLYYQWQVVKKWCTLCLLIVGVLWIQLIVVLPILGVYYIRSISMLSIILTTFSFGILGMLWSFVIKPFIYKFEERKEQLYNVIRFKRNIDFFVAILEKQRKVDTTLFENEFQIANGNADLQVIVVCNPYCTPCAKIHNILNEWVENFGEEIGISIRFAINHKMENAHTRVVEHLLQFIMGINYDINSGTQKNFFVRKILHEWFMDMDFEKLKNKYPLKSKLNVARSLQQHSEWCVEAVIQFTPTIFINGYQLPMQYTAVDMQGFLISLLQRKISPPIGNENSNMMVPFSI